MKGTLICRLIMLCLVVFTALTGSAAGQQGYQKPPKEVLDVLHAPPAPSFFISPRRDLLLEATYCRYPSIKDLSAPMERLAGVRIDPRTNNERSRSFYWTSMALKRIPAGTDVPLSLPSGMGHITFIRWNAAGTMAAFTCETADRVSPGVLSVETGKARVLEDLRINPVLGAAVQWMPDQKTLIVKLVPDGRGAPPLRPEVPQGPKVQESSGVAVAASTYEARDLLKSSCDADLFDYYARSQVALVDAATVKVTRLGKPDIYGFVMPSPDGSHILVERLHRPYSFLCASNRFPRDIELWNASGRVVECLARQPLAEEIAIDGVLAGPRAFSWKPTAPATLIWAEALDGGNPGTKVPFRDRIMQKPVGGQASELWKSEFRFNGLKWLEKSPLILAGDIDQARHWRRTFLIGSEVKPRLLWELSTEEKYRNPGWPVVRILPSGFQVVAEHEGAIYLAGDGSSPEGERPFLDRLDLQTFKTERLFRSGTSCYESFQCWLDPAMGTFITMRQSPAEPPNLYYHTLSITPPAAGAEGGAGRTSTAIGFTNIPDPVPQLRGITKRLVTYTRADGVPLSFMLYLPPGYKEGTRLPTVLWAYPLDYTDKTVAGQIGGSSAHYTTFEGVSVLFFLLRGYAVLDKVAMPVVGPSENSYDTFVEQITANAKAAVDKAVEMGIADRDRIGVCGHSHGGLMTANLLAYTDIFRAGIACSGAYNHTIRPFGFQNEKRTLWQARDSYIKISPVLQADRIKEPLLIIHGELDQNPGTVPMQSEKLYEAVRGVGGTVRLVMLPYENHGYEALESVEHVLYEMQSWFDRYVKNAAPRSRK